MKIKVKFPNGQSIEFECPQNWTINQIKSISSKQQKYIDQDSMKIYYAGVELNDEEQLINILKQDNQGDLPTFLIALGEKKQNRKSKDLNKPIIYEQYIENLQTLELVENNGNYLSLIQYLPINTMKFQLKVKETYEKQNTNPHQGRQVQQESRVQQEIFFHFKIICQLCVFYTLFSQYFKGENYYIMIAITTIYYWIKYQEFRAQLRVQQAQQQERQQNEQQQQNHQDQQQQQQQQQQDQNLQNKDFNLNQGKQQQKTQINNILQKEQKIETEMKTFQSKIKIAQEPNLIQQNQNKNEQNIDSEQFQKETINVQNVESDEEDSFMQFKEGESEQEQFDQPIEQLSEFLQRQSLIQKEIQQQTQNNSQEIVNEQQQNKFTEKTDQVQNEETIQQISFQSPKYNFEKEQQFKEEIKTELNQKDINDNNLLNNDEPELEETMRQLKENKKLKKPSFINFFKALFELIYCYIMSLFPFWHVGLYQQQ